jgi:uncharacterized small protein (DUF1192 family)
MPETLNTETPETESAETDEAQAERDVIARLADRGQQTVARLAELPGGTRALNAFNDLRNRVDEMGKKVRGIDELEKRVAALEDEVAALTKKKTKAATPPPAPEA